MDLRGPLAKLQRRVSATLKKYYCESSASQNTNTIVEKVRSMGAPEILRSLARRAVESNKAASTPFSVFREPWLQGSTEAQGLYFIDEPIHCGFKDANALQQGRIVRPGHG